MLADFCEHADEQLPSSCRALPGNALLSYFAKDSLISTALSQVDMSSSSGNGGKLRHFYCKREDRPYASAEIFLEVTPLGGALRSYRSYEALPAVGGSARLLQQQQAHPESRRGRQLPPAGTPDAAIAP